MALSWAELPTDRVVRLRGAKADAISLSIDPLPDSAPAIVTYFAGKAWSATEMVAGLLNELETAAIGLFPAWLPGAEGILGPGGAGAGAVRALALRTAAVTGHFGPFLAELAELSLAETSPAESSPAGRSHRARRTTRFGPEVRAVGLARVLAASFNRRHVSILVHVPEGLPAVAEEALVAGCEWLAHRGELGVWLTGAPLVAVDRVAAMTVRLPDEVASLARCEAARVENYARDNAASAEGYACDKAASVEDCARDKAASVGRFGRDKAGPVEVRPAHAIRFPAAAGRPHPASDAEQALEAALATCDWAVGRAWNQTYQSNPLTNPIRVDLLWRNERCVVEVDGPEHRAPLMFAADRCRDVQLQLDGFAVLRFTNDQIATDTKTVLHQIERFLLGRRATKLRIKA